MCTHWDLNNLIVPDDSQGGKLIRHFSKGIIFQLGLKVREVLQHSREQRRQGFVELGTCSNYGTACRLSYIWEFGFRLGVVAWLPTNLNESSSDIFSPPVFLRVAQALGRA